MYLWRIGEHCVSYCKKRWFPHLPHRQTEYEINSQVKHLKIGRAYPAGFAIGSPGAPRDVCASDPIRASQVIAASLHNYYMPYKSAKSRTKRLLIPDDSS